jgi:hypothetical protein
MSINVTGGYYIIPSTGVGGSATILWSSGGTAAVVSAGDSYSLSAVTVFNYSGGTVFAGIEQGQNKTLTPSLILDTSGNTVAKLAPDGTYTIADFTIINQDGQSALSVNYSGTVYTDFSGGSSPSVSLVYQRPTWRGQETSYEDGDAGWQYQSGTTKYTPTGNTVQTIDYNSIDPFYTLTEDNIFGSKFRFTDMDGNEPSDGMVGFPTAHWTTGGTQWCVIDHLTGLLWFQPNIGTSMRDWGSYVSSGHSFTWSGITDWRLIGINDFTSVLNFNSGYFSSGNIFKRDDYSGGADTSVIFGDTYLQSSTQNFYGTSAFDVSRAEKTTSYNSTYGAYVCKDYLF